MEHGKRDGRQCHAGGLQLSGVHIMKGKYSEWGTVTGDIEKQSDLMALFRQTEEALRAEAERAQQAEDGLQEGIREEAERAGLAEEALREGILEEAERAQQAETDLQDALLEEAERAGLAEADLAAALQARIQSYTHTQSVASTTWNVQHNFGTADELLVFVKDTDGNLVWCEADYPSSTMNLLVLRFGVSMAGTATVKWLVVSG